jgi:glucosamine--fructose-6-phosphate aminotransferase (isomerizing)
LAEIENQLLDAEKIIIAPGDQRHAALIGKHLIEEYCRIPVEVEYASEFRYRNPIIGRNNVLIVISQSGRLRIRWLLWEATPGCAGHRYRQ